MLTAIARVFGYVQQDWSTQKNCDESSNRETIWKSDFAWACASTPITRGKDAQESASPQIGSVEPEAGQAEKVQAILSAARSLLGSKKTCSGTIAFVGAFPNRDPGLELDVLTPHHTLYHSSEPDKNNQPEEWRKWHAHRSAPDTEDPVPVYFPAVKRQSEHDHFIFPLIPLRFAESGDVTLARNWLSLGLELFGIGAKTCAGYGVFNASEKFNQALSEWFANQRLVAGLVEAHRGFENWEAGRKEESILLLSDRQADCRLWKELDPKSFGLIERYADSIPISLT